MEKLDQIINYNQNLYSPHTLSSFGVMASNISGHLTPPLTGRAVIGGGHNGSAVMNSIEFVVVCTTGNASDFGDLVEANWRLSNGVGSATRGIWSGGSSNKTRIQYVTIATEGDATNFGSLTVGMGTHGSANNGTRGVFGGGKPSGGSYNNTIQYITIDTTGDSTDFGDMDNAINTYGSCYSETRGVFGGGYISGGFYAYMEYITIASAGNGTGFGDLTLARVPAIGGAGDGTYGLIFAGGYGNYASTRTAAIDYITIASVGNAGDFGDL